jgi:toxin ParE1/3/4
MSFALKLQSEAIFDLQEAFEWYELQQQGLGYEFIEEAENGFKKICAHPLHYKAVNDRFRRIKITRFPYLIIYEIENNTVIINSVRHGSRKPKF